MKFDPKWEVRAVTQQRNVLQLGTAFQYLGELYATLVTDRRPTTPDFHGLAVRTMVIMEVEIERNGAK